jgi:hypothetical protein
LKHHGFRRGVAIIAAVDSDDLAYHDLTMGFDVRTPPPEAGQAGPSLKIAK